MTNHTDLIARLKALYPSENHWPTIHEAIAALAASPTAAPDVAALIELYTRSDPAVAAALLAQQRTIAELEREIDDIKQVQFPRRMVRRAMYDAWAANRPEPAAAPDVAALIARLMKCPPIAPDRDLYVVSGLLRAEVAAALLAQQRTIAELEAQLNATDHRIARISGEASRQIDAAVTRTKTAEAALAAARRVPPLAIADVIAERERQVLQEGWTPEHDDEHRHGELQIAAACLCVDATDAEVRLDDERADTWGLAAKHHGNWRRQLVIAGALIVAAIEQMDRDAAPPAGAEDANG